MSGENLDFVHRFIPSENGSPGSDVTMLVLHGTGGSEDDLVPLGKELAPGAAILSPRGKVSEFGAARFFRRLAEGVFDHEDLVLRTHELAGFIENASEEYGFDTSKVVAAGYSNGANIAASLMLLHPGIIRAVILFRSMVPFEPEVMPDLSGTPVFMAAGSRDQMIPPENTQALAEMLGASGAEVEIRWRDTGHGLTYEEVGEAKAWMADVLPRFGGL